MNILHIGKKYYPDHGGIESVTKILAEASINYGNNVSVCCFTNNTKLSSKIDYIADVKILRCHSIFTLLSQPISLIYIYKIIIESRKADIIHFHFPNILAILALPFINNKKILLVHWHSDILKNPSILLLLKPLINYLLYRSSTIITTSDSYKNSSHQLKNHLHKTSSIPLGVKSPIFNYNLITKRFKNPSKYVITVGRLVGYKGFETLISSFKFVNQDIHLLIVGSGECYGHLTNLIHENKLNNRVKILTDINDEKLQSLYENSFLFCLPSISRAEAFGVAAVEALSYGLPIIASNLYGSGLPWVNQHKITGLNFKTGCIYDLAKSINHIANSEHLYRIYSSNSRARYLKEFTSEIFTSRFSEIYKSISSN